ncbi:hypothetical protein Mic7113_1211 [Allocoleopsis franciscana PCC 7113]|uniref:Uncharacterized protein n=1 Tax=Allocoleopsis franciscana PCC 7113 TaxID=1173027 RepID=K9WBD1_9CYAN|nr:hypothetical protein Mic7113_1211 [Allocoleopsis franciscana PCC 7113]
MPTLQKVGWAGFDWLGNFFVSISFQEMKRKILSQFSRQLFSQIKPI